MPKPATIYDVAARASVSISTVSNALNRPDRVGDATRAKVLAVADELGFTPKSQAVSRARKSMGRIGVVAPFVENPSYFRRLTGVLAAVSGQPLEVSVFNERSAARSTTPLLARLPAQGQVDGLIVMGEPIDDAIEERMLARGLPVVLVDADSERFSVVGIDDEVAGRITAEHLLGLGHRRLGFLLERQETPYRSPAVRRLEGFRQAVESEPGGSVVVEVTEVDPASTAAATRRLLDRPGPRTTAVVAHHDGIAVDVLNVARARGIHIPDDLSVTGFDDGPVAVVADLTTVRQPFEESGAHATRVLMELISAPGPRTRTILPVELVSRGSSGQAPRP